MHSSTFMWYNYKLQMWPAPRWLDSSAGSLALHWYHRGHGFKSRSGLNFFRWSTVSSYMYLSLQFKYMIFHIHVFVCSLTHSKLSWMLYNNEKQKTAQVLSWSLTGTKCFALWHSSNIRQPLNCSPPHQSINCCSLLWRLVPGKKRTTFIWSIWVYCNEVNIKIFNWCPWSP